MRSCLNCWWREGGLCYAEPCERGADGRSTKPADQLCEKFDPRNRLTNAVTKILNIPESNIHRSKG